MIKFEARLVDYTGTVRTIGFARYVAFLLTDALRSVLLWTALRFAGVSHLFYAEEERNLIAGMGMRFIRMSSWVSGVQRAAIGFPPYPG